MKIAIFIYEGMTALDAIGPYEVLARLPGAELLFVSERAGEHRTDTGRLGLIADKAIAEVDGVDLLVVPGGPNVGAVQESAAALDWIRSVHKTSTWTTSVCTGSLILGAAGVLEGRRATTHWYRLERLRDFGAEPVEARFVEDGKIITAAGVSAGIDMGLHLLGKIAGDGVAQAVQLGLEYDPAPPYASGSPKKAPEGVLAMVEAAYQARGA